MSDLSNIGQIQPINICTDSRTDLLNDQESRILQIQKGRLDSPLEELDRLEKSGFITKNNKELLDLAFNARSIIPIERSLRGTYGDHVQSNERYVYAKTLYAIAWALRNVLEKTHYVFLHAQEAGRQGFSYLMKELVHKRHPDLDMEQFEFLRAPKSPSSSSEFKSYQEARFIDNYQLAVQEDLLSVDAAFQNTSFGESAHTFLTLNKNATALSENSHFTRKAIQSFYPDLPIDVAHNLACETTQAFSNIKVPCGNLFVIGIPKKMEEIYYRAHPVGSSCKCHKKEEDQIILEKLQKETLDLSTECTNWPKIPQYRIYTPALAPGRNQKIFSISPLKPEVYLGGEQKIKGIVRQLEAFNPSASRWQQLLRRIF